MNSLWSEFFQFKHEIRIVFPIHIILWKYSMVLRVGVIIIGYAQWCNFRCYWWTCPVVCSALMHVLQIYTWRFNKFGCDGREKGTKKKREANKSRFLYFSNNKKGSTHLYEEQNIFNHQKIFQIPGRQSRSLYTQDIVTQVLCLSKSTHTALLEYI